MVKDEIPSIVYDKVIKHQSQGTSYRNVSAKGTCLAKKIDLGQENSWKVRVIKGRTEDRREAGRDDKEPIRCGPHGTWRLSCSVAAQSL